MADIQIGDILGLLGGKLDDKQESKTRFREFILQDRWEPQQFEAWLKECAQRGKATEREWYNAMQDLVVAIGKRLGFVVDFGRYGGSSSEIAYDGLWRSGRGGGILLEVKASGWPVTSVAQLGEYVNRYVARNPEAGRMYGLFVVGEGDFQHIIDQIRGGDYRNTIRLISFEDLIKLWRLKTELEEIAGPAVANERIESILLPMESVNVGVLVRMLLEIAELRTESDPPPVPMPGGDTPITATAEPWGREELHQFFRANTDWQNAFLSVLAEQDEPLFSNMLISQITRVAAGHMPAIAGKSLRSVAGVRAGFRMRRGDKEDFIGNKWDSDGENWQMSYWLKPQYKTWVREWIHQHGWTVPGAASD